MRGLVLWSLMLAMAGLTLRDVHAAGPLRPFQFGLWSGGAYTNQQTGAFSHCAAGVPYLNGISMLASINRSFAWSLGFYNPQWTLTPKIQIPIALHFDRGQTFNATGTVIFPTMIEVPMPDNSNLISTFRYSSQMRAQGQGYQALFNLNGTAKIMLQLVACVRTELALETAQPGSAPPQMQVEENQLATNFLLAAQLPNAHMIPRPETPPELSGFGAAWKADDAMGAVKIFAPRPDLVGLGIASDVIAADARLCKGKFASARSSDLLDSEVVFRAATSCLESDNERSAQYFIAPRPKGGFVAFLVLAKTQPHADTAAAEAKANIFKKAALGAAAAEK